MTEFVRVYWNLTTRTWSVLGRENRVTSVPAEVWLAECRFVVRPGGRDRCLRERRRNVHAFATGFWFTPVDPEAVRNRLRRRLAYDPYRCGCFFDRATAEPVHAVPVVLLSDGAVYAT